MTAFFDFRGKVALVTGATKGIGRSIAKDFLDAKARVIACARGKIELQEFASLYPPDQLLAISTDATQESEVQRAIQTAIETMGAIDILVNNVGGAIQFGHFWDLSNEAWIRAFELNVLSMVNFVRHATPALRRSPSGRIINISSISGVEPGAYNPHYTSTKASTINFSKYLANALAKEKILVNCICPGTIETDAWTKNISQLAQEKSIPLEIVAEQMTAQEVQKIPLQRLGQGTDISQLVLYLASEQASWITGTCFHVNGGKLRAIC